MNVLIVFGHPEAKSFNGAMRDLAVQVLTDCGHDVRVSDLYGSDFEPALSRRDFLAQADDSYFNVIREQANAFKKNAFSPELKSAIDDLLHADLLILQCPIWWFGLPAIVKGWIDRVFVPGATYGREKWYETGRLAGKRALVSMTCDVGPEAYQSDGRFGAIEVVLWPINSSLRFVGFDVLAPHVAYHVSHSEDRRKALLRDYAIRLRGLSKETPLYFHPLTDYDENDRLKPGVEPRTVAQRR